MIDRFYIGGKEWLLCVMDCRGRRAILEQPVNFGGNTLCDPQARMIYLCTCKYVYIVGVIIMMGASSDSLPEEFPNTHTLYVKFVIVKGEGFVTMRNKNIPT